MFNPIYFYEAGKVRTQFVSTWKTNNTSTGSSTATQVKLPLVSTGTYNFVVDWGDGTSNTITTWNAAATTHTYSVAGTYTIKIKGTCTGWVFGNTGDRLKILSVQSWGKLILGTTQVGHFYGCSNLTLTSVSDVLDLTGTLSLNATFQNCSALTIINRINEWNTSAVTTLQNTFAVASLFNSDLSNWNTQSVTNLYGTFNEAGAFNNGLASGVAGTLPWNTSNVTSMFVTFRNAFAFNCNIGSWNVSNVTNFEQMFNAAQRFNNGGSSTIGNWVLKTSGSVSMTYMFRNALAFNQPLNGWNTQAVTNFVYMFDNNCAFNNGLASGVAGTLNWNTSSVVSMGGMFATNPNFNCNIGSWDVSNVTDFGLMFQSASKFNNGGSTDINNWILKTTGTINMTRMFQGATIFNQPLNNWNTQAVNNMSVMFFGAFAFNNGLASGVSGPLNWNTSAVTTMNNMFYNAIAFNQDISSWNTSVVIDMASMFTSANKFNQNIGIWNTSAVTNMSAMFQSAGIFNQDISTKSVTIGGITYTAWDVSKVTNMSNMFRITSAFNKDLSSWDVSKVTTFDSMFLSAIVFNNGLASGAAGILVWNTLALVNMTAMFQSANAFNQNIGSWNVSKVTNFANTFAAPRFNNGGSSDINNWTLNIISSINMNGMFQGSNFNQPINNWNVSKVTNMGSMFLSNNSFNQPLNLWNTSSVTNMQLMFNAYTGVNVFNQDIGMWNVSNVTNFINFMQFKTPTLFSAANLDSIYNGWSSRPVKPGISITFGSAKYTAASSAGRAILTGSPNNWLISDGGI